MTNQQTGPAPETIVRAQRRWLYLPFAVFALLAVAYTAMWFKAREVALNQLNAWVSAEKARGQDAGYHSAHVVGYPLRFGLEIEGLHRIDSVSGKSWTASRLRIDALPYDLQHVIVESLGPQTFIFADHRTWTLNAKSAMMSLHWDKHGLVRLSGMAKDINWASQDGARGSLKAYALQATPTEKGSPLIRFESEAVNGHVPPFKNELAAFGQEFKSIKLKGQIDQAQVFAAGFNAGTLDLWSAQKGAAQFTDVSILWGEANLKGSGQIALDRMRRITGKIDFTAKDSKKLAASLAANGWVKGDAAHAFIAAAQAADILRGGIDMQLEAKDGELLFWSVPVKELKPLYSPTAPDAAASPVAGG